MIGTTWRAEHRWDNGAAEYWTIEFRANGLMHYTYQSTGVAYDNGHWSQRGAVLFWDTNQMFSAGLGVIRDKEIRGTKVNVRGQEGTFIFRRER